MNKKLENIVDKLQLDKSKWKLTKFGNVAIQQKQTVDRDNTDLTRYIQGGHMTSEDLHIRNWGELTDEYLGPAFIRKFEKDDILYGSRRTYLRKVAIADFDGITSNTTFVIKANESNIDKRLLPFIMLSEGFTENSVRNSKGSVNPYINWKDISEYEFLLPPKEQQVQLAELLWALDEVIEREINVLDKLNGTYDLFVNDLFDELKKNWELKPLKSVSKINKQSLKNSQDPNYEFKYLDIAGIVKPKVIGELQTMKFKDAPGRARRITSDNSIIISMVRPYHKSFAFLEDSTNIVASTGTAVIEVDPQHNPKFIFHQFFSKRFMKYCEDKMTGTNYPAITPKDIEQFEIALPNEKQIEIKLTEKLEVLDFSISEVKNKISDSQSLQKSIINQIF
jgi:type I restriction enzyme S subunit